MLFIGPSSRLILITIDSLIAPHLARRVCSLARPGFLVKASDLYPMLLQLLQQLFGVTKKNRR